MGGGGTTVVNQPNPVPGPSPEELEIQRKNSDILSQQLEAIKAQNGYQQQMYDRAGPLFDMQLKMLQDQASLAPQELEFQKQQIELAKQQGALQSEMIPLQKTLMQKQLEQIQNGFAATPEQAAQIDATTNAQLESGRSDISEFSRLGLEQLKNELAPSLGMRPTDTPIQDRGFQLEREGTRQYGQLQSNLRAANSQSKLNVGMAGTQMMGAQNQFQQQLSQSIRDFQAQLSEQAAQNRLKVGLGVSSSGVATAGTPGSPYGLTTGMMGARYGGNYGGTSSTTTSNDMSIGQVGQLASGIGALAAFSDRRLKTDIERVGQMRKTGLPVYRFRYKGTPSFRLGVMADEVEQVRPDAVGTHRGFKLVDYSKV